MDEETKEETVAKHTAGSRTRSGTRNDDAGAGSLRSIEQLLSHPVCLRNGHEPDDWQQQAARVDDATNAIAGNVIAAITNAVRNLRTARL